VAQLRRSRLGSAMLAVRANERSAAAAGVDVTRTKLAAFAIASFVAGIGGSLLAISAGHGHLQSFDAFGRTRAVRRDLLGRNHVGLGRILAGFLGSGGLLFVALNKSVSVGGWFAVITAARARRNRHLQPGGNHRADPTRGFARRRQTRTSEFDLRAPRQRFRRIQSIDAAELTPCRRRCSQFVR